MQHAKKQVTASSEPTSGVRETTQKSPLFVAAEAAGRAEDGLADLPLSPDVRELHGRVLAVRTVLLGIVREGPVLTQQQRERLARDAVALAEEVVEIRRKHEGG